MSKWVIEEDKERNCYRILTEGPVTIINGILERQWIADVFEYSIALKIVGAYNRASTVDCGNCALKFSCSFSRFCNISTQDCIHWKCCYSLEEKR